MPNRVGQLLGNYRLLRLLGRGGIADVYLSEHRDVKPENMLVGANQEVLLSDFGISLLSPSPEQLSTQNMAGTLPYMAPEQIRGKPTFASDQYSLGIVVYEWLCGERPFVGPQWQLAYQQVSDPPPA